MQFNQQHQLIISPDYIFIFSQSKAAADAYMRQPQPLFTEFSRLSLYLQENSSLFCFPDSIHLKPPCKLTFSHPINPDSVSFSFSQKS